MKPSVALDSHRVAIRRVIAHIVALAALAALAALPRLALAQTTKLTLTGSSTLAPVITELAKRFRVGNPGVDIVVEAGGSARGAADALAGRADIGMVSRDPHPDEKDLFVFTIARDGIALVVHADNPVKALSREQIIGILSGRVTNWKTVGGADAPIHVCSRKPGHASIEIVTHYFGLAPEAIESKHVVGDSAEALQMVLADRNLLTYFSVGLAEDAMKKGRPVKTLPVEGVAASSATVSNGTYPLARTLNLVTRGVPKGVARAFIEFVQSPRAREAIAEYDFVPYGH